MIDAAARPAARLRALVIVLVVGWLASLAISWPVWVLHRTIPPIPWVDGVPAPGAPWDFLLAGAFALSLMACAVRWRSPLAYALCLALAGVLFVQDALRAQPWFYQYALMLALLLAYAVHRGHAGAAERTLRATRFLCAAVYFYSAAQKVNFTFIHEVIFYVLKAPIAWFSLSNSTVQAFAVIAIALEVAIGVGLLFRPTRKAAVLSAVAMHAAILVCLGPLGQNANAVVWPWNLVMIGALLLVAWDRPPPAPPEPAAQVVPAPSHQRRAALHWWLMGPSLFLACVMPAFGVVGLWPAYLSWSMYGGGEMYLLIGMSDSAIVTAPRWAQDYSRPVESRAVSRGVLLAEWVAMETAGRIYPEAWYERALARAALRQFPSTDGLVLVEYARPDRWTGVRAQTSTPAVRALSP